jgi:hypothetical protein
MRRLLTASALLALAIFATSALGRPQPDGPKLKPADDKKAEKKPADPTDAAIAAALANDPDVKMARAKIQLAEAELAKARQVIALRVVTLKTKIDQFKTDVATAQNQVALTVRLVETGNASAPDLLTQRAKLEAAKSALALAEAEWKLLTVGAVTVADAGAKTAIEDLVDLSAEKERRYRRFLEVMMAMEAQNGPAGTIPDRIRSALDKPVKLGAKGEKVTLEKALEVFKKEAGLDVPIRGTFPPRTVFDAKNPDEVQNRPIEIVSEGEELPVGVWFQLFEDNTVFARRIGGTTRLVFYVREYGLLISSKESAPPDAPTLTEFWKQKPAAKEPRPIPEPKPK